jgi:hypothetical protein
MRYEFVEASIQGHGCCFGATVWDTTKPTVFHGKQYADENGPHYEPVCECLGRETAELVCKALNAYAQEHKSS